MATQADANRLDISVSELWSRLDQLGQRLYEHERRDAHEFEKLWSCLEDHVEDIRNRLSIETVTRWLRHATLRERPLISVVLPTKDRPHHLGRAVRSVLGQRYENWELLVVDDGAAQSRRVIEELSDSRIKHSVTLLDGESVARNLALERATGDLIAYLDDDNVMDPEWLFAVAWAFEQRPDIDVLYGAHIIDDYLRMRNESYGALPITCLHRWNRERIREGNLTDMSAIAHRAGLPEARFDESVKVAPDWEILLRLTAEKDPLVLPVVACYYTTDAPGRISARPSYSRDFAELVARVSDASAPTPEAAAPRYP